MGTGIILWLNTFPPSVLSLFSGVVVAVISVTGVILGPKVFATRVFISQRLWERRVEAYSSVLERMDEIIQGCANFVVESHANKGYVGEPFQEAKEFFYTRDTDVKKLIRRDNLLYSKEVRKEVRIYSMSHYGDHKNLDFETFNIDYHDLMTMWFRLLKIAEIDISN